MLDVDGVLINGRPADGRPFAAELEADLGIHPARLHEAFFKRHWDAIVTGKAALEERLSTVLAEIAPRVSAEQLIAYWFENDSRIDAEVLATASGLRARGWRVFLATNQEHRRAAYLMDTLGFRPHVDGIVYSAALGCRKPWPAFFEAAETAAGTTAADIVFVDDALANVETASRRGWRALHWTGNRPLSALLAPNH